MIGVLPRLVRLPSLLAAQTAVLAPVSTIAAPLSELNSAGTIPQAGAAGPVTVGVPAGYDVFPGLEVFSAQVNTGQANQLTGVYVPGEFALPVQQQPSGRPEYVSEQNNILTQFSLPDRYGVTGLLAHNYLSGSQFFNLSEGQEVVLVYGNGRTAQYQITGIQRFQALSPESPFSRFVDLSDSAGKLLSSSDLFTRIYTIPGQVVFQTCIQSGSEASWGRLFIIATPLEGGFSEMPQAGQFLSNN
jgi:hypothetical protein